ncbi:MAG TPA: 2,3-bisphosphoglycerate-independent phosphoglycerate mutase [Longimicrobiales bacterium]|nr:2,3-bisphosphoglycerate-independent phosphoglycerate mutase [Longimicrobiales bacterium]
MDVTLPDAVVEPDGGKIVLVVMDGLGGLPHPETGRTELESASTPNLDDLATRSALGLSTPVAPGISPGSGPGHLALFGYDPVQWNIGRGVLSALGVDFELRHGDVAARLNLATLDDDGNVADRRAGRPSDEENARIVAKLRENVKQVGGVEVFWESEKEHRVVLILRGSNLSADLSDTDPQETGVPPAPLEPTSEEGERTVRAVEMVLNQAGQVLADEPVANAILARGWAAFHPYPSLHHRFGLRSQCIARYPMYRGVSRLLGMDISEVAEEDAGNVAILEKNFHDYDFFFVHFKYVDSRGEDGDFDAKVAAIEAVDALIPGITALDPDVLVVTGDHSTPANYRAHSWHPVPALIASDWCRPVDVDGFGERACLRGELGTFEAKHLTSLALAHAGRLAKFGA